MEELKELTAPIAQSFDLGPRISSSWCHSCDPRLNFLVSRPVANDLLLDKQLIFDPSLDSEGKITHGNFIINRLYCAGWNSFPTCTDLAQDSARKLVEKLQRFGHKGQNYVAREASYKVQVSYYQKRVRWATAEDMSGNFTCLPQLAVISRSKSSSARLCIIPNRPVFINRQLGARTYNSFVRKSSLQMPPLPRFYLGAALSVGVLFLDFSDCFGSLRHSPETAKHSIVFCLKDKHNLPTYDLAQAVGGLQPLLQTSSSYGASDVPALSQRAVSRMVEVYRQYCPTQEVPEDTLLQLQSVVTTMVYVDDSFLSALTSKLLAWCETQGRLAPFPTCSCPTECRDWSCDTLRITKKDLLTYQNFVKREVPHYLLHLAKSFLTVANFSRFRVKHIKATNLETQELIDQAGLVKSQTPELPEMPFLVRRPTSEQMQMELQKGAREELSLDPEDPSLGLGEEAAQLGKTYKGEEVYLKTFHLYISYFQGRSKRKSPPLLSLQATRDWCSKHQVTICKLTLASLGGQLFDTVGRHLILVRVFVKEASRLHLLDGPKAWETPVSSKVSAILWKAVEAFFLLCAKSHPRSNLFLYPAASYFLLCGSDGSTHLQAWTATLVSFLHVDGQYQGKAMHLALNCYSNHVDLNSNIPLSELLAALKGITGMLAIIKDLESYGIHLAREQVLFCLDAKTVLLQLRTRGVFYQKRFQALILRIQCMLAEANLSVFDNLAYLSQKDLPDGARYHADICSKSKQENATRESILKDDADLHDFRWMELIPPSQWSWIQRDAAVPALDDRVLVDELGVDPDFLAQVRGCLAKPHSSQGAHLNSLADSPSPLSAGLRSEEPGEHNNVVLPSQPQMRDQVQLTTVIADAGQTSLNLWKEQVETLLLRKRMYLLGAKGAITILTKVLQFVTRLKDIVHLPQETRTQLRARLSEAYHQNCKGNTPWGGIHCREVLCGLGTRAYCGRPHFKSTTSTAAGPPGKGHLKKEAHSLFTSWSTTGHGLGVPIPDGAEEPRNHLGTLNLSVEVFSMLCFLNNIPCETAGFAWEQETTKWGKMWVGRGRLQRHWQENVDFVPILRPIEPSSTFAQVCLLAAHASSLGQSSELPGLFLASLRVHVPGVATLLRQLKKDCFSCNLMRARAKRQDTMMKSKHLGPSGQLISLGTFPPGWETVVCDLTGPVTWLSADLQDQSLYFLVCVSSHYGETRIIPIESKQTEHLVLGLKTLALQKTCQFSLLFSDMGGEFRQVQNTYSPMKQLTSAEPLVTEWFSGLLKETRVLELAGLGSFVCFGGKRHSQVSKVETRIGSIKKTLRGWHIFGKDRTPSSLFEIHYLVALAEYILHSRPLLLVGNQVYSLQTLRALTMQGGLMQHPKDGIQGTCTGSNKSKVEAICMRLTQLRSSVTASMMEHCLPSLLDTPHRRERAKQGLPVDLLKQNDVIFDTISYMETGCMSGNLARVAAVGKSSNHVLVSKAVLGSPGTTFEQQCISRPSEYCHFICPGGTTEPVSIGDDQIFDVTKYLPKSDEPVPGVWQLPGPSRVGRSAQGGQAQAAKPTPSSRVPANGRTPTQDLPGGAREYLEVTPSQPLIKGSRVDKVTRSGRVVKKPTYYY